jgi:hypothetical protein
VEDELLALRFLARFRMQAGDASEAIAAMDEAQRVAHATGLRDAEICSCSGGLELRWADGRLAEARERIDGCLDLIDGLRDRETLPVDRARVFARFSHVPGFIADALLGFENDIQSALRVLERYRARSLEETIANTLDTVPEQLAEVGFLVGRLHRVRLVDDVHQVHELGGSPEDLGDAGA